MPADLIFSIEVAVGALLALVGAYVLATVLRRRAIARGKLLAMCAYQRPGSHAWRQGYVRFGEGDVEWYPLGGLSLRPRHIWARRTLDIGAPVAIPPGELDLIPDAVCVPCRASGKVFQLGLARTAYTALRSWVEAAPPSSASAVN
ncbi:MAG: DUF2550 domain-containing protein [Candidatus Phosphoribacter sp.]|nr:DUF2550 domain-containing protein [Actinomycetales bacterium]